VSLEHELLDWLMRADHEPLSGWAPEPRDEALHCHPDLVGRLSEIAKPVTGTRRVFVDGYPVIHHPNGAPIAVAAGTNFLAVRSDRPAGALTPRTPFPTRLDGSWAQLDPWTVDVAFAKGIDLLRGHVVRAFEMAEARAWR
jgi:hypothetical protein